MHKINSLPGTCTQSFFSTEQASNLSKLSLPYLAKQPVEHILPPLHLDRNIITTTIIIIIIIKTMY
jgi:hypothetical protein